MAVVDLVLSTAEGTRAFYDIDTPVTLAALRRGEASYIARDQIPRLDLYFSFSGGRVLDSLAGEFGARHPHALYCSVDDMRYQPSGEDPVWDLGYLGTYSADRQPVLERLLLEPARRLPDQRFVVAGPQYPDAIAWPSNVERIEHLPPAEHSSFYNRQRFTLNVTRADMAAAGWSPSVRLFEAAACGTPIISDRWPGLDELFPDGDAILIADGTEQVVTALSHLKPRQVRHVGERARSIVLAEHTGTARARELVRALDAAIRRVRAGNASERFRRAVAEVKNDARAATPG
jgi:spore maturation protein CgeB